jgi:hypothetical protein
MKEPLEEIATTLQGIQLPPLSRPALGPNDPPTLELVQFDLKAYAYSWPEGDGREVFLTDGRGQTKSTP